MKNNVDFIYEYSDLRVFYTRAKVLIGQYAGLIVEFGGSGVALVEGEAPKFDFQYDIMFNPADGKFHDIQFLADLLIDIIADRREDPDAKKKLDSAAMEMNVATIKIPDHFYAHKATVV